MRAMSLRHTRIAANGLSFHVALAGPEQGPLVLLLHGFPEFWYGWRHQADALAGAGYRVAMPDQRGYGDSDKPRGVRHYALDILADDVAAMALALGAERFVVVGHDWGGMT
jgi:pimeloyl-ACP methyl ester carboxylesterase